MFELYDMDADPYELHDIAAKKPGILADLRGLYQRWFDDIMQTPGIGAPPPIHLGARQAPRVVLTRQDMKRVRRKGWGYMGYWLVDVVGPGPFRLSIRPRGKVRPSRVHVKIGDASWAQPWGTSKTKTLLLDRLPRGTQKLEVDVTVQGKRAAAYQVEVRTE